MFFSGEMKSHLNEALDKNIAFTKLRSKNKFSIDLHCEQLVSSKRNHRLRRLLQFKRFIIVILPIKVRLREDYKFKIFFVLFNKNTEFNSISVFALSSHFLIGIDTPKYLKISVGHFKPLSIKGFSHNFCCCRCGKPDI